VCAAIALHFNWDVTLMRIAFVVSLALLGPIPIWVYVAAWLMTPFAQDGKARWGSHGLVGKLFSPPQSGVEQVK